MVKIMSLFVGIGFMVIAFLISPGPTPDDIAWVPISLFFLSKGLETSVPSASMLGYKR